MSTAAEVWFGGMLFAIMWPLWRIADALEKKP